MAEDKKIPKDMPPADKKAILSEGPIKVEALRAGFYKKTRKVVGDQFEIEGEHQLGTWMKRIR